MKPPPKSWGDDKLTNFFDFARENGYGTFHNKGTSLLFERAIQIDKLFLKASELIRISPKDWLVMCFFLNCHSTLRAALQMAVQGQFRETFILLRNCLENMLYAFSIFKNPHLEDVWLNRDKDSDSKKAAIKSFKITPIFDELEKDNRDLKVLLHGLYNQCIDFGAHPNQQGLMAVLKPNKDRDGQDKLDVSYLSENPLNIALSLKSCLRVGISCVKILEHIYPKKFKLSLMDREILDLSGDL